MGDVVNLGMITSLPTPVGRVIDDFVEAHRSTPFKRVLVIGVYDDGDVYYGFSDPDGGTAMWDMELLKHALVKVATDKD